MRQNKILLFIFMLLFGAQHSNAANERDSLRNAVDAIQISLQKAEQQNTENKRNFVIAGSVFLGLLIAGTTVNLRNRKRRIAQESGARKLMLHQEKEREQIARKLHDSIGQNILFIRNQMIKKGQTDLISSVDETIREIRNISRDLYPSQLEKYGLIAAVDALIDRVTENADIFISHDLEALGENLQDETRINFYRIIQECISNSLKYSEATALRISTQVVNGAIILTIQDNGKGFDKSVLSAEMNQYAGILNMEERVKSLLGKFELETSPGNGTKYAFTIPAKTKL